jgi:hypothetical protein
MSDRERWAWRPQSGPQQALVVLQPVCAIPIDGARHSLIGLHQYYAHNCTHDVHGAGGEAQLGACRIEYEIQPKERDPEAASCRQFCHLTAHTDFLSYAGRE